MKKVNVFNNLKKNVLIKIFEKKNHTKIFAVSLIVAVIIFLVLFSMSFMSCSKHIYNAGEYVGLSDGYHSHIKVKVITNEYRILSIEIISHEEMPVISEVVFKDIPRKVIRRNTTDVDTVSGATYTSKGLLKAIDDALFKAMYKSMEVN
jgi:uncharacterized protein with FMN-binding domain